MLADHFLCFEEFPDVHDYLWSFHIAKFWLGNLWAFHWKQRWRICWYIWREVKSSTGGCFAPNSEITLYAFCCSAMRCCSYFFKLLWKHSCVATGISNFNEKQENMFGRYKCKNKTCYVYILTGRGGRAWANRSFAYIRVRQQQPGDPIYLPRWITMRTSSPRKPI
jgi:hypothetical protein